VKKSPRENSSHGASSGRNGKEGKASFRTLMRSQWWVNNANKVRGAPGPGPALDG